MVDRVNNKFEMHFCKDAFSLNSYFFPHRSLQQFKSEYHYVIDRQFFEI